MTWRTLIISTGLVVGSAITAFALSVTHKNGFGTATPSLKLLSASVAHNDPAASVPRRVETKPDVTVTEGLFADAAGQTPQELVIQSGSVTFLAAPDQPAAEVVSVDPRLPPRIRPIARGESDVIVFRRHAEPDFVARDDMQSPIMPNPVIQSPGRKITRDPKPTFLLGVYR